MSVRPFDHDFVEEVVRRVSRLRPDTKPAWGAMTPPEMIGHLIESIQYSMGRGPNFAIETNWFKRRLLAPLVLNGILKIPKNIKAPRPPDAGPIPAGDVETLHAVLEDYLALAQADELTPAPHPAFGVIGVDGWAKMHVHHFEHHLTQFGV
jgi:oxepin-CoA hydrolase/3-oxo-5,6-dehydrosuberyl-CoA semialdehyde dehydrogenase